MASSSDHSENQSKLSSELIVSNCNGKAEEEEEEDDYVKLAPKNVSLPVKIAGVGRYLPPNIVKSSTIDILCGKPTGFTEKTTGIKERRWANSVEHVLKVRREKFAKNVDKFLTKEEQNLTPEQAQKLKEKEVTIAWMGAEAAREALKNANLKAEDLDLIVNASGTPQRTIPGKFFTCYNWFYRNRHFMLLASGTWIE